MNRARTLELLRQHKPFLVEQFGVTDLALFGSVVRDAAVSDSDIDILVSFNRPAVPGCLQGKIERQNSATMLPRWG